MMVGRGGGILRDWILGMDGDSWVVLRNAGESNVRKI
jgi:hypothetical protein